MTDIYESAGRWLQQFETAITNRDVSLFDSLFLEKCDWRDLVAFTWNFRQFYGRTEIRDYIWTTLDDIRPSNFALDIDFVEGAVSPVEFVETETWEINFTFETAAGYADGLVNVVPDETSPVGFRADLLFTRLQGLRGHDAVWPRFGRYNHDELVEERRRKEARADYAEHDPEVLVIGGGHNGLFVAAALGRLGIDTLVVDKYDRAGDNWRNRYDALVLHQPHGMLHFPFMPFPENFPDYVAKDRMADWLDAYVAALDINLWTSAEFVHGEYDEAAKQWSAVVRRADGATRTLHPKHLVLATGGSGTPQIPNLPGLSDFAGTVSHSEGFKTGADYAGKRVLVIGAATSAHDIAFDVFNHGGQATMFQRGPVAIVDLPTANLNYGHYNARQRPTEALDKRWQSTMIEPRVRMGFKTATAIGNEADVELHRGLEAAGFKIDWHEGGWFTKYYEVAGGYYINVGASQAIIDGNIHVRQYSDIDRFVPEGVRLKSGEVLPFDAVVLATGYAKQNQILERFFGSEVAERIGEIDGFDAGGEPFRGCLRPIPGQPRLIIMESGISPGRWYTPLVALQVQAELEGIVPESFRSPDHPSQTPKEKELASH
ncbi:flavin-containing monooxygenase [Herbiconiux ginsengi]|uniref:Predicted flavoprotein CzcO associated with the cation diffusion facilitator CzcD n=1 Tax=Herbiconiux ginsengi TaxID=381665 RepID=A0A1H3TIA1_9MICO|nr:NAD(P)/FAD-dependent oxidoreductase [Herbiconiux ginsengi]SDZ49069.1 Predicted flavoprotein CzcO associated with the cation diffusion facilitator CzcD [Herbiconiux ginsengi]